MAKSPYAKQFKPGTYPDQHWDESVRYLNTHEQDPPSNESPNVIRRRQGISRGSQTEAYPGMVGKNDYSRKRRK